MKKSVPQFHHYLLQLLLVALAALITSCGGSSDSPSDPNSGNNNEAPNTEIPPYELVVDLGPDMVLVDYCSEVWISAGRTTATSFKWTQPGNGPRVGNLGNEVGPQARFTPAIFAAGTPNDQRKVTLLLTATDEQGNTATDDIVITFLSSDPQNDACNTPPVIQPIPNETVLPGSSVVLTAIASDAEDGTPVVTWRETTVPPQVLGTTGSEGSTLVFNAPLTPTTLRFEVTAKDSSGATASTTVEVQVEDNNSPGEPNQPPVANAGEDQYLRPGDAVNLSSSGSSDPDGNIVSYLWTQVSGTPTVSFDHTVSNPSFTAPNLPDNITPVDLTFELTVTDNSGAEDSDTVVIHVAPNIPPTANAGPDITVDAGDTTPVSITGSGIDSDGNILHFIWTQVSSGPRVTLTGSDTETVSFDVPSVQQTSIVTLRLTVVDDGGATGSDDVSITIRSPLANTAPVANAGVDDTVNAGDVVTLQGGGEDPDGDPLIYLWRQTNGTPVAINNANTPNATFEAPAVTVTTELTFELTVSDDKGASGTDQTVITVNPVNVPPTVDVGADFAVLSGDNVTITGNASDQDGQITQYQWTRISGPTVDLGATNGSTLNFFAPDVTQSAQMRLRLTVIDDQGAAAFDDVIVTINPRGSGNNAIPVVDVGADISVVAGDNVSITGNVTDDGQIITYIWTQMAGSPALALNTPATPTVSFIAPNVGSTTTFTLRLTAVDDAAAIGFDEVNVTVTPANGNANIAPIANAGTDRTVVAGNTVSITGSGSDSDGSISAYQWTQRNGISVSLSNANTETVTFTAPTVAASSSITLRLTVTDDMGATGFDEVIVTVNPVASNSPPTADAGPDLTVDAGQQVTINGSGSDSDGAIASYEWSQVGGQAITLTNTTNANLQFNAPAVQQQATATLRLTVTDNLGATGFDDVVITINPVAANVPPTADAGPDVTVTSADLVTINGSGSDVDGRIISYLWTQVGGTPVSLNSVINPTVEFTAPPVQATVTATLRLTVTDNLDATGFDEVVITITPGTPGTGNQPPVANAGTDQAVNIQDFVALTGSGSDADGTVTSFSWAQVSGPSVTLNNANTANANFTAPVVSAATALGFELTVSDNSGNSAVDSQVVTVYPLTTLSGTITTQSGTQVDSDVNDTSAAYVANDSVQTAQALFNPVVLGGYVNLPGQGTRGRSTDSGDVDDYFSVSLSANQAISLYIGDVAGSVNDLDLYLLNQAGEVVDASTSPTASTETLTVPAAGNYVINVKAVSGASNYVLSIGVTNLEVASNGWRLSDDFQAGDVVVQFQENTGGNVISQSLDSRAASVGLQAKAGAPGRNMLLGLGSASQRATVLTTLGIANPASLNAPSALQDKLDTLLAAKSLAKRADVIDAGLNYRYYPTAIPNDTNYNLQWHYPSINLPQAWDITTGSSNVIVAVIDTGVLLNHPDLQGQLVGGYDFIADNANSGDGEPGIDANPNDPGDGGGGGSSSFHGTHVSGTIAAASNNGVGVAGIAWGAKIMPCRAIGINGGLRYDIEQCVRYVSGLANDSGTVPPQRADIINLSLGGPTNTTTAPAAYRLARDAGVIVIAAAGNDSSSALFAPAAYNGVVSVSATNISRQLASYSNFGSTIDVAAPGGDSGDLNGDGFFDGVLSTGGDDSNGPVSFIYRFAAGTSMASPHMAGVVALMKSVYPGLTPAILDSMLANGELTDDLGSPGRDNNFGYGIINAQKAVTAAANVGNPAPPPPPAAVLQLTPTSLNLGIALTNAQFTVSNAGGGTLDITNVTNDSSGWLTVAPGSVDANGLGSYIVSVDRGSLLDGVYNATITVTSSVGTQTISVIMQVNSAATSDNAGFQYIELIDMETMLLFDRVISRGVNGVYEYTFSGVPLGMYHVRASSDLDKDGVFCEVGDSCGAFPTLDIIAQHVIVDGLNLNRSGLDFTTGFSVHLTTTLP